jgi:hypothetical protein
MKQIIFRLFVFLYLVPIGSLIFLYAQGPDQTTIQEQLQRSKTLLQQLETQFHAKADCVTKTEKLIAVLDKYKARFSEDHPKMKAHLQNKLLLSKKKQSVYANNIRRAQQIVAKLQFKANQN